MLQKVETGTRSFLDYSFYRESNDLQAEIEKYQKLYQGIRLCHINSTPYGGGVAELLYCCVPLLRGIGVKTDWLIIEGNEDFFRVTKAFHNALQGAEYAPPEEELAHYINTNQHNSRSFNPADYDVIIVHDPQPAALCHMCEKNTAKWVWRCHIDTSSANQRVLNFLQTFLGKYDYAIFSLPQYVPPSINFPMIKIMTPSIDPLSPKNQQLPIETCRRYAANKGLDTNRPIITQVSRFDIWKDPIGVIRAYQVAKKDFPGLQLVLIGSLAADDPEGMSMLEEVREATGGDADIHIFCNLPDIEVNAFQRASDIIIQKSIREGFGLTVTEGMWKRKPVIGGNTGGIALQLSGELNELLVNNVEECAAKIVALLKDEKTRKELGDKCYEKVRNNYLIIQLLRDEMQVLDDVLKK